jgi:ABC-2 type transport system permease protein
MATEPAPAPQQPLQPYGEIYDLGYKHYDGPRLGRAHALRALIIYSIKRGLGIKKKWTAKIIPILLYMAAFIPAIVVAGILAFLGDQVDFDYNDLNSFIEFTLLIYAAALAPEMLCDDRRENVLSLYFSRALTRLDYLLSKVIAMAILMGTIAFGPLLLLWGAKVLQADDPIAYLFDHLADIGRIFIYGTLVSAFFAAIGLGIAAYTNRKGIASGIFIGGVIFMTALANALYEAVEGDINRVLVFFSPMDLVRAISLWLFDDLNAADNDLIARSDLPGITLAGAVIIVVALTAFIMYRRYLTEE